METTEKHEEKASEILARAAKLLNDASKVYEANFELMKEQDALQQDLLHKLEIENLTRDERAKLATELRDCRRLRRKYKDVVEELEPIAGYCGTAAGMQAVSAFKNVLFPEFVPPLIKMLYPAVTRFFKHPAASPLIEPNLINFSIVMGSGNFLIVTAGPSSAMGGRTI